MFVHHAERALAEIAARGRVAFLVGGTHHYVRALLDRFEVPSVAPRWQVREELEQLGREGRAAELHARLSRVDPAAAASIPMANVRRVVRALEVFEATGQAFSEVGRRRGQPRQALRLAVTMPREQLYARIDARIDHMLQHGWLDEVRGLLASGHSTSLPALTSTGYRELIRHLQGETSLDEAVRQVKYSTHAYVRRQYAWLRRDADLEWLEQGPDLYDKVKAQVEAYLSVSGPGS
jgi:tRNA dimethylallyltransferase